MLIEIEEAVDASADDREELNVFLDREVVANDGLDVVMAFLLLKFALAGLDIGFTVLDIGLTVVGDGFTVVGDTFTVVEDGEGVVVISFLRKVLTELFLGFSVDFAESLLSKFRILTLSGIFDFTSADFARFGTNDDSVLVL